MSVVLPPLDAVIRIDPSHIREYQDSGWTVVRELATSSEIQAYRDVIQEVALAHSRENRPLEERDTYGKAFLQITNLWRLDERVKHFVLAKRFAQVAAELMGVDLVRIYHDQALFKEPGGGHTPWHQDGHYWPVEHKKTITMWMPLVDISEEMGSMSFAERSHIGEIFELDDGISDHSDEYFDELVREKKLTLATAGAMKAGDATFHSGLMLHKAPGNPTDRTREVMTIIYLADGMKVQEPANSNQQLDMEVWFPGLNPGDLIDTELNPIV